MRQSFLQRLHARVYAGSWKNPLFADPKVKERALGRTHYFAYTALVIMSCIAACSGAFWFATQPRFALYEFRVEGMRTRPSGVLAQEAIVEALACRHFFVPCVYSWNIARAKIESDLMKEYPLEDVHITITDHLFLGVVREAVTVLPLRIGNDVWFASQTGILQSIASPEDIAAGIIIPPDAYVEIDASAVVKDPQAGMQVLTPETFSEIAHYRTTLTDHALGVTSFVLTSDVGKIRARTQAGFEIFFTPWEDAQIQVGRLVHVLAEATPNEYADIRFGERIYIK